ncbi:peptidase M20 [Desulfovibrio sp. X2]|uniref:M20 family metallopeptidase n=1 Tax=Desulfovibrio sp. X2 TaxID=941449 RepID=UPI000358C5EB|nr:M20 family metallopeptidase [Desulfovibrio sp. X2]EPR37489.1 peptidase M20 [Desulfovibrio sp. X2]
MRQLPDPISLARTLVRTDTSNPPGNEEPAAHLLGGLLEEAGFSVRYPGFAPGRTNVVAELPGADMDGCLCLSGHMDTVPAGQGTWSRPPFSGELAEGRLWGRGSADMKGGVAALVSAAVRVAARAARSGRPLARGLRVVLSAGEETGLDGAKFLETQPGLLGRAGAVVVAEPTDCRLLLGHKGVLWLDGTSLGRSAHGSMPEQGDNALYKACEAALKLRDAFAEATQSADHPVMGRPTLSVNTLRAGGKINVVPARAELEVDIRLTPGLSGLALMGRLQETAGELCELRLRDCHGPAWTEPDHPFALEAAEAAKRATGAAHPPAAAPYFTDGSVLARAYPGAGLVLFGPGAPSACHTTDESCPVEQIATAATFYEDLAAAWCRP